VAGLEPGLLVLTLEAELILSFPQARPLPPARSSPKYRSVTSVLSICLTMSRSAPRMIIGGLGLAMVIPECPRTIIVGCSLWWGRSRHTEISLGHASPLLRREIGECTSRGRRCGSQSPGKPRKRRGSCMSIFPTGSRPLAVLNCSFFGGSKGRREGDRSALVPAEGGAAADLSVAL
jgi:hypothetical protein